MESNLDKRKSLGENEITRNFALILGNARAQVEKSNEGELEVRVLKSAERLLNHFIEINVEQDGVIATWKYKPLELKEDGI